MNRNTCLLLEWTYSVYIIRFHLIPIARIVKLTVVDSNVPRIRERAYDQE
jgi:hypothetical protein